MLAAKCPGEAQFRLPVGVLSGSIGITLWDCEGSMEPSRLGWDCEISSHLALNKSCDDTEALHCLPLENVVLDPISNYLQYRSHPKSHLHPPQPSDVSITWCKTIFTGFTHVMF